MIQNAKLLSAADIKDHMQSCRQRDRRVGAWRVEQLVWHAEAMQHNYDKINARLIAAEARANAYENTLAQLAAQSTGRIGSTLKSDCMAALASAALRTAILTASADGAGR